MVLWFTAVGFAVLWAVGVFTSHTMGGYIHALLAAAFLVALVKLILGRKVSTDNRHQSLYDKYRARPLPADAPR